MDVLGAAAAAAAAATVPMVEEEPAASPEAEVSPTEKTKGRRTGIALAQFKLESAKESLLKKTVAHDILVKKTGVPAAGTARAEQIFKSKDKVSQLQKEVQAAERNLEKAKQQGAVKAAAAAAAAAAEAEKVDKTKTYSEQGILFLVQTKFKHEKLFRNTKDRVASVWATVVKVEIDAAITAKEYPEGDRRSAASLTAKFSDYQGLFRHHVRLLQAAAASGASRDALDECDMNSKYRNITTDTFFKHGQAEMPMAVPPLLINSDSAAVLGMKNLVAHITKKQGRPFKNKEVTDLLSDSDNDSDSDSDSESESESSSEEEETWP